MSASQAVKNAAVTATMEAYPQLFGKEHEARVKALVRFSAHVKDDPLDHIWGNDKEAEFHDAIMQKDRTRIADIVLESWAVFDQFLLEEKAKLFNEFGK